MAMTKSLDLKTIESKLDGLDRLLSALTAFGSLELGDYNLIVDYISGSFGYVSIDRDGGVRDE